VESPTIRPFKRGDEPGIQNVIKGVFDEYGFTWEPDGYNLDSVEVEKYYHRDGGGFWVMQLGDEIIGTVGLKKRSDYKCELYRLYLKKDQRGLGYGKELYQFAQKTAREMGFQEMEIWSDKRLEPAHAMYGKSGAISLGDRICNDPDNSEEWGFLLTL
jgi:putative acetyltransferase